jgi:two-component system, OmpR family, alkaline phosphatase synthesis response regulator PhoP
MAVTPLKFYIVDDDPDAIELIALILEKAGHKVQTQVVGLYAISEIVRARPDCVLIDLMMGGIDGLELCRELRARPELKTTKLAVVTGKSGEIWRERAMEAGANGFFNKPVDPLFFADNLELLVRSAN